jgi:isopenicillin N synthase-like dioxygenase
VGVAERLCSICHEVEAFRLVDHGVEPGHMEAYFDALQRFFASDASESTGAWSPGRSTASDHRCRRLYPGAP